MDLLRGRRQGAVLHIGHSAVRAVRPKNAHRFLFDCKPRLKAFFHYFVRLTIYGDLPVFYVAFRKVEMTPSLSLATFC